MSNTAFNSDYFVNNNSAKIYKGVLGFRNRIINGDFRIDQRSGGASITGTASNQKPIDRWGSFGSVASKFTMQQNQGSVTPPPGFSNYFGFTSSSAYTPATNEYFMFYQNIEGGNVADFLWGSISAKNVVLSFWVRSSLTGTFGGAIVNGAGAAAYAFSYNITNANTWKKISITVPGTASGTWPKDISAALSVRFGLGSGSTYQASAGSWGTTNVIQSTGSVNLVATSGATWYITGVQLELGDSDTDYELRPLTTELQLCQRYFQNIVAWWGIGGNSSYINAIATFEIPMRTTPTLAKVPGSTLRWRSGSTDNSSTTWSISTDSGSTTTTQVFWFITGVTSITGGAVTARGNGGSVMTVDAEY